jgi:hypothetical protein
MNPAPNPDAVIVLGHPLAPGQRFYARTGLSVKTFVYRGGGLHHSTAGPYLLATSPRTGGAHTIAVDRITRVIKEKR